MRFRPIGNRWNQVRLDPSNGIKMWKYYFGNFSFCLRKDDPNYGIPTNELTLKRGKEAHNHISNEVFELIEVGDIHKKFTFACS